MKLKTLAIAVAMASVPFAAQAEFTVGGDVGIAYSQNAAGVESFGGQGSEVTFDAWEKVGDLTWFGHFEVNVAGATVASKTSADDGDQTTDDPEITLAGQLSSDDMYLGVKGGFGTIKLGDTDNGCDTVDTGWVAADEYISHSSGGCGAGDQNNITYSNSAGSVSYAVSYSPDVDFGSAETDSDSLALGIQGKLGAASVSLGYETLNDNIVLGVSSNFGPVAVGIRASENEDQDDIQIGYTANYEAGNNVAYIGIGDTDRDTLFLGYQRKIGSNTRFITEFVDDDNAAEDQIHVGLKHSF